MKKHKGRGRKDLMRFNNMKKKNKIILIPIFNNDHMVRVCWGDEKFLAKIAKDYGLEKVEPTESGGRTYYFEKKHPLIVLAEVPKTDSMIGILAHEATHAMNDIYEYIEEENWASCHIYSISVGIIVRETLRASLK